MAAPVPKLELPTVANVGTRGVMGDDMVETDMSLFSVVVSYTSSAAVRGM